MNSLKYSSFNAFNANTGSQLLPKSTAKAKFIKSAFSRGSVSPPLSFLYVLTKINKLPYIFVFKFYFYFYESYQMY